MECVSMIQAEHIDMLIASCKHEMLKFKHGGSRGKMIPSGLRIRDPSIFPTKFKLATVDHPLVLLWLDVQMMCLNEQ